MKARKITSFLNLESYQQLRPNSILIRRRDRPLSFAKLKRFCKIQVDEILAREDEGDEDFVQATQESAGTTMEQYSQQSYMSWGSMLSNPSAAPPPPSIARKCRSSTEGTILRRTCQPRISQQKRLLDDWWWLRAYAFVWRGGKENGRDSRFASFRTVCEMQALKRMNRTISII